MPRTTTRAFMAAAAVFLAAVSLNGCAPTRSSGSAASASDAGHQHATPADKEMVARAIRQQQQRGLTADQLQGAALCKPVENGIPMPRPRYLVTSDLKVVTTTEGTLFCEAQTTDGEKLKFVAREWRITDAAASAGTSGKAVQSLVIQGNGGRYLSPYTSDGVVAEWVNKTINNRMGSATGSAVGGVVGAAAANQALDNVPGGGIIGGFVGAKAGKAVGNKVADDVSGGDAYRRQTSDLSFASLDDMAAWLANEHGDKANFAEVIRATEAVYPGLVEALKR